MTRRRGTTTATSDKTTAWGRTATGGTTAARGRTATGGTTTARGRTATGGMTTATGDTLGCAFCFVFRFLPGVIFWNPRISAAFPDSVVIYVRIKSFQGKINLVRNSKLRNSGRNSGGKDT